LSGSEHHVLRAQVAVHDLERSPVGTGALVHVGEPLAEANADRHRLGPADAQAELRGPSPHLAQVATLDVFDHHVRRAVLVGGRLQDLRHSGVLELRLDPSLVEEARLERAVLGVVLPDDLHDQRPLGALDARRRRQVHLAHSAASHPRQ
jgi:hypothetical protein